MDPPRLGSVPQVSLGRDGTTGEEFSFVVYRLRSRHTVHLRASFHNLSSRSDHIPSRDRRVGQREIRVKEGRKEGGESRKEM